MKILEDELRLLKELNLKITTDTEAQLATIKDEYVKLSAKQVQELAEARSERDDSKYSGRIKVLSIL
jgi:hypothetical protein